MRATISGVIVKTFTALLFVALVGCGGATVSESTDPAGGSGGGSSGGGSSGGGSSTGGGGSSSSGASGGSSGGPVTTSTYLVAWDAPGDPQVTGYRVYFSTTSLTAGGSPLHVDVPLSQTSVSIAPGSYGVRVGTTLYVGVSSRGASNEESPVSSQASILID